MITIAGREIGPNHRPYIIAEMSGNHNQSLERGLAIVDAAAQAGADAIKLQTYTASTMTLDCVADPFIVKNTGQAAWDGKKLFELYQLAHTPWEWHKPLMERAAKHGLHCFSTPFDETAVDFLESLNVPAYKIASFECTDLPLIKKIAATGKPMIISTGMATLEEIKETVDTARKAGCKQLVLLKCTSTYPASPENTNISTIPDMRDKMGCDIGLSDHTMGCGVAVAAVAFGAVMIEKHFTLRRADGGVDSTFSMEPEELKLLRVESERAWQSLGKTTYGGSAAEQSMKAFRRGLWVAEDMKAGDAFVLGNADKPGNLRIVRPAGSGLAPKFVDQIVGQTVNQNVKAGTPVNWEIVTKKPSRG
jgi:N-acetylneuraminate synthase